MTTKDIRRRIGFVFFMLFLYKVGTHIPVPGINASIISSLGQDNGMLGFMNSLSGGALQNFSILAVGIMPYITSSIVIQLLSMDVVPKLTEWSKQGEAGQKKTKRLTYFLTIILGFVQSIGMSFSFNSLYPGLVENPVASGYILIALCLTLGTVILMIMGELIDKKGIGKGMSILIFAGIMMSFPNTISMYFSSEIEFAGDMLAVAIAKTIVLIFLVVAAMVAIIYVTQGERRIPLQYANQKMIGRLAGPQNSFLPLKVNGAGVIPVIFASALIMAPVTISQFFPTSKVATWISSNLNFQEPLGMILYAIFILLFSFFYTFVQINPEKIADSLKMSGGSVPGIRPGKETETYLTNVLKRLTTVGSLFLMIVAILPIIIGMFASLPAQIQIGGTTLIIVIGVAIDLVGSIKQKLTGKRYTGNFLNN